MKKSITILQNIIVLKSKIHNSKNNVSKEEKLKLKRITFRRFKTNHGMFIVKNFSVVCAKNVYYSTKIRDRNLEVNLTLTVFHDVGKSENIAKHETKEYHKDALEKAKDFLESSGHILEKKGTIS